MELTLIKIFFLVIVGCVTCKTDESSCNFYSDRFWKLCDCKNVTICQDIPEEECKQRGCCYAPESFVQAKGITKRCLRSTKNDSVVINGECLEYNGTWCKKIFENITISNTSSIQPKRYIDTLYGIQGTDRVFQQFLRKLDRFNYIKDPKCLKAIPSSLCQYAIPICHADGTPEQICREDCEYMYKLCGTEAMKNLVSLIQFILIEDNIDFTHLALPHCNLLQFSWDIDLTQNKSCGYLYDHLDRRRPVVTTPASVKKSKVALYAAVSSAVLLLFTVIIAAVCLRRYHRRRRGKKTEFDFLTTMTSIRDRIREESQVNPLLEMLANSKPGDLIQYPLDCVEYIQDLGEGQFGKVFQGRVHGVVKGEESTDVAVKCLKEGSSGQALESFHQEVALMSVLEHINVLRLLAVSTEEEPYCMIFEFMENGDLNEYLRKCKGKVAPVSTNFMSNLPNRKEFEFGDLEYETTVGAITSNTNIRETINAGYNIGEYAAES